MYYKIQKSLGRVSAVLVDNIPQDGVCVEFKNFSRSNASIVIYQHGKPNDLRINGYTFPCVYNYIKNIMGTDIYGGDYAHVIDFEFIDPSGALQHVTSKNLYGGKEALAVEYFYSLLYNISCCKNVEQYEQLYEYIIDKCKENGYSVQTGIFGADMKVELLNDGPVTICMDTKNKE